MLLSDPELKRWIPEEAVLYWQAYLRGKEDNSPIADLEVLYDYRLKRIKIGNVAITSPEHRLRGYGREIYEAIPGMTLPSGESFEDSDFEFVTEEHSDDAERLWRRLEQCGQAEKIEGGYRWVK